MKIEIFEEESKDQMIYLRLVRYLGKIQVHACDAKGKTLACGHLCSITPEGVQRCKSVDRSLGFELDENDKLKDVTE